jgi:hypothetical protein
MQTACELSAAPCSPGIRAHLHFQQTLHAGCPIQLQQHEVDLCQVGELLLGLLDQGGHLQNSYQCMDSEEIISNL